MVDLNTSITPCVASYVIGDGVILFTYVLSGLSLVFKVVYCVVKVQVFSRA